MPDKPSKQPVPRSLSARIPTSIFGAFSSVATILISRSARGGYLAAMDQSIISLANFAATIILARNASPTELGVYGVGFTTLRLVRAVQEGVTIQPLNTFGASMQEADFRQYAANTSLLQITLALISAMTIALLGLIITKMGNDVLGPTLYSLWPAFLFWQLQEYLRRMLYTRGRVLNATLNTTLANAVRLGAILYWLRQGDLGGAECLLAIAMGSLVALVPSIWQTRSYWYFPLRNTLGDWARNWAFGRWIMGGWISNWIAVEFYPVLTAGMVSFAAAGAYRAIQTLVAPIHLLLRAVDTYLTPRFAQDYQLNGLPALTRLMRLTYLVTGAPIVAWLGIILLFPKQILHLFYGDTYLAFSNAIILLALFYTLMYAYWPLQIAFKAIRLSQPIFAANLAAILVMFTAGLWLIQNWGVYGTIAGQALNSLTVLMILRFTWIKFKQSAKPS